LTFVQQESEFFDLDRAEYGLRPVHCDVWNGFIFINFDAEPRQTLREFLGPMITGLDDYPFAKLTERYDWVAHNNSNWKIFADAFQEYYHVPSLHSQQVPSEVRDPNAGFTCGHFQLDGPHRLVSTAGRRRWLLPPEYMYPIERATRSGLVGPWRTPDIGELPARAAGLLTGKVVPRQLVSAVSAHVVEGADLLVSAFDHDHRSADDLDLLGEIAADSRQLLHPGDVEPGPFEDRLTLEFVELPRRRVSERDGTGSQFGVVLGPGALRGPPCSGHRILTITSPLHR
jgi:hypothetical protein